MAGSKNSILLQLQYYVCNIKSQWGTHAFDDCAGVTPSELHKLRELAPRQSLTIAEKGAKAAVRQLVG